MRIATVAAAVLPGAILAATVACSGQTPPAPPPTPSPTVASAISWVSCTGHAGWQCGTLQVPLDHAQPGGSRITIALNRHPAGSRRIGSLLVNPGGPGVSGLTFAYQVADSPVFTALARRFDIVGFDPRGVGASTPIHCVDGPTLDRLAHIDPNPDTPSKLAAVIAGAQELARGCAAHSLPLLAHVSTVDAAQDLDDIRAALGDPTLSYLGFSYGTLLGATYAALFPTRVRALALDSAIDPTVDEGTMSIAQAVAFEQNLNAFLSSCASSCSFTNHGAPSKRAAFDELMARIDADPLPAGPGRTLGAGEALFAVADPLYTPTTWPALAIALEDAESGDGAALMSFYDDYAGRHPDGHYDNVQEANTAINCLDHPTPPSIAAYQALAATASRQAPYFGAPVVWGNIACLYWPVPPPRNVPAIRADGNPPIVVVGSTGDPATPYAWAGHLATLLHGRLITREGQGHGAYLVSPCVRDAVDAYLISLTDPPAGLDCRT